MYQTLNPPNGLVEDLQQRTKSRRTEITLTEVRTRQRGGRERATIIAQRNEGGTSNCTNADTVLNTRIISAPRLCRPYSGSEVKKKTQSRDNAIMKSAINKTHGFFKIVCKAPQLIRSLLITDITYPWDILRSTLIIVIFGLLAYANVTFFCSAPLTSGNYFHICSLTGSSPHSFGSDESSVVLEDYIRHSHGNLRYLIRDRVYTKYQMEDIKVMLGSSITTAINASSLPSRGRLLQDLTLYQSASDSAVDNIWSFNSKVHGIVGRATAHSQVALDHLQSYVAHGDEQEFIDQRIESIADQLYLLNASAPKTLDSLLSLDEITTTLKTRLRDDYESITASCNKTTGNGLTLYRWSCAPKSPMTDTSDLGEQIATLETIIPVIEDVVQFVGHLLWRFKKTGKDLEYLIENTLRLKRDCVYNEWYGRVSGSLYAEEDVPIIREVGWKGVDQGLQGLKTALAAWSAFDKDFLQSCPLEDYSEWMRSTRSYSTVNKLSGTAKRWSPYQRYPASS